MEDKLIKTTIEGRVAVVTMDAPSNVARYRVSFRTDAGVVAHVDRRSEQPVATAIVR